jgi:hypothetical protein
VSELRNHLLIPYSLADELTSSAFPERTRQVMLTSRRFILDRPNSLPMTISEHISISELTSTHCILICLPSFVSFSSSPPLSLPRDPSHRWLPPLTQEANPPLADLRAAAAALDFKMKTKVEPVRLDPSSLEWKLYKSLAPEVQQEEVDEYIRSV